MCIWIWCCSRYSWRLVSNSSASSWSKVEENLKEIAKFENIIIRPGITVGAWNVNRLPEIITHLVDIGVMRPTLKHKNFFLNLLSQPSHYHVHILPDDYREATIEKLEEFITDYNKKYGTDIEPLFIHIIHELKKPFSSASAKRFLEITDEVDLVRNEKLFDIIPELNILQYKG